MNPDAQSRALKPGQSKFKTMKQRLQLKDKPTDAEEHWQSHPDDAIEGTHVRDPQPQAEAIDEEQAVDNKNKVMI